jgi:outer membrane protein assembly factor BamB
MRITELRIATICLFFLTTAAVRGLADDWPAWRGLNRDGICMERGLLKQWPKAGPRLAWKATGLGEGYSGPSIVDGILYTMGNRQGDECVFALDTRSQGDVVWATPIGRVRHDGGGYPGPRSTPTVDGGRVYVLGCAGDLVCLDAKQGRPLWKRDLARDFGGQAPPWGYAESVLIDGPRLLCTPGGKQATIVALQKASGQPVWTAKVGDDAQYSSIVKASVGRVPQYVNFTKQGVIAVRAEDGRFLWRYDRPANGTANVATPVWHGQTIFAASAYGTGGGLVWPRWSGDGFEPQQIYFTRDMKNHHGGLILYDGCLYGANDPNRLMCLDYKTGRVKWSDPTPGKCSLLLADGMLYCRNEDGPLCLVQATPEGFHLNGRFDQPDRSKKKAWPHPVIADGMLFLRDQDVLLCYDVQGEETKSRRPETKDSR